MIIIEKSWNLLFSHGHNSSLVHLYVVDSHATEDGEGLDEVLVVGGERQVVELKLINVGIFKKLKSSEGRYEH